MSQVSRYPKVGAGQADLGAPVVHQPFLGVADRSEEWTRVRSIPFEPGELDNGSDHRAGEVHLLLGAPAALRHALDGVQLGHP